MVLGDWNRRLAGRGDAFFADLDDGQPTGADLTLTSGDRRATCKARFREFIDFIVGAAAAERVKPGSFVEHLYDAPEDTHPSEPSPLSVQFEG